MENNKKFIFLALLLFLNLILRIPTTPHEIGVDSFKMHILANSLSTFGEARWWLHPASIFGSYPYSYASALPFLLSGTAQLMGVEVEKAVLAYSIILGLSSVLFAYLMAGVIWENEIYKIVAALIFSTSQGIVTSSTWVANARTLFVIIFPLFIYLLLKTRSEKKFRFILLAILLFFILATTHHYIYFVIPILVTYLGLILIFKLSKLIYSKNIKIPEYGVNATILALFLFMFIFPFLTRAFMKTDPRGEGGSRYGWMITMWIGYFRYLGVPLVFAISGYIYLLLIKHI
jgi:hypothetical protein